MKKFAILLVFLLSGCTTSSMDSASYFLINKRIRNLEERIQKLESKNIEHPLKLENKIEREFWLKLRNGSKRKLIFTLKDNKWVGPKNEHYDIFPTEKEIKLLYYE